MKGKILSRITFSIFALALMFGIAPLKHADAANVVPPSNVSVSVKYCQAEFHWTPAHYNGLAQTVLGPRQVISVLSDQEPTRNKELDIETSAYVMPGLSPYTSYRVVISAGPVGHDTVYRSEPVYFKTAACGPFNPL